VSAAAAPVEVELRHVAPTELLLERNIRDPRLDPAFVKSIKEHGVLEPITAVLNADGGLVVRFGHRRTLGAVEAGLTTVPVVVRGADDLADSAEVDRIIRQHDENVRREGLTAGEQIGVIEQLGLFGVSAAQIARRLQISRDVVDAATRANASELARKAADRYEGLTIDQAAAVAEFDDDVEVAKALIVAAVDQPHQFAHAVQQQRDERARAARADEVRQQLLDEQCRIVDEPDWQSKAKPLTLLVEDNTGHDIDPVAHRTCRGHVAWIAWRWGIVNADGSPITDEQRASHEEWRDALVAIESRDDWTGTEDEVKQQIQDALDALGPDPLAGEKQAQLPVAIYGCSDPTNLGHRGRHGSSTTRTPAAEMSDHERKKATEARRLVVENNKAWDSAQAVRRDAIKAWAGAKKLPPGGAAFIALAVTGNPVALNEHGVLDLAGEWLGIPAKKSWPYKPDLAAAAEKATNERALVIVLIHALAAYEHQLSRDSWREDGTKSHAGRYLRFLEAALSYPLSDVEKYATSKRTV